MEAIDLMKLRRNIFGIPTTKNVCRSLFGEVDHEEVKIDLEREYKETLKQKSQLWNFDFGNYCPGEESEGLKWIPEVARVTEYTIKTGHSMVSSFSDSPLVKKQKNNSPLKTLKTIITTTLNQQKQQQQQQQQTSTFTDSKQTCIKDFTTNKKCATTSSGSTTEDEVNVIEIITESPIRNITKENVSPIMPLNSTVAVKLDISENTKSYGKRKRSLQPTIDDFMKKKKPRTNVELSSSKSKSSSATRPIASRLRSSPAVKIQV